MPCPFLPYSVALVTPFDRDGSLKRRPVEALVDRVVAGGAPALLVSGSTGEQHSMTVDERARLVRWVVRATSVPVYAGVAAVRTADAVALARKAASAGAAGLMVGFPPYVRLGTPDALAYLDRVVGATDLPVLIYNNPLRTAFDLSVDAMAEARDRNPRIAAVKQAGDPDRAPEIRRRLGPDFGVYSGSDRQVAAHWRRGYTGLTSIAGNLWTGEMGAVVEALVRGDFAGAEALLAPRADALATVVETQLPATLKHGLRFLGLPGGWCREPLGHLAPETERAVEAALAP